MKNPLKLIFYRPMENHLGTVYRLGYLRRLVPPRVFPPQLLLPFLDKPGPEVDMGPRMVDVSATDLMTRDSFPVDLSLKVFFRVNLIGEIDPVFLKAALRRFTSQEWASMVKSQAIEVCGMRILPELNSTDIHKEWAKEFVAKRLVAGLAEIGSRLGLMVTGVSVQHIQISERMRAVFENLQSAPMDGQAAIERLRPFIPLVQQDLPGVHRGIIWAAIANALRSGELPDLSTMEGRNLFVEIFKRKDDED